jgi:hypothetical protein
VVFAPDVFDETGEQAKASELGVHGAISASTVFGKNTEILELSEIA